MATQFVLNVSALFAVSLTLWSAQPQGEAPVAAATAPSDPRLLARIVTRAVTNGVSAISNAARTSLADKLTEKDLLFLLTSRLQPNSENGELELELARLVPQWKPISASDGMIDVRILDRPNSGLTSQFALRFEVVSGDKSLGIYFANVKARLYRNVCVASSALRRGTALDQASLQKERRDVISFRDPIFSGENLDASTQLSNLRLTESVQAGGIVLARHVQARPVMFRGDHVQAVIQDEVMSVSLMVEVLAEGAPGQLVKARNLRTKKEIQGKVIDENTIQVLRRNDR